MQIVLNAVLGTQSHIGAATVFSDVVRNGINHVVPVGEANERINGK